MEKALTQEKLKELLHYDQETGVFRWLVQKSNRISVGDIAGCNSNGYLIIGINGVLHRAHRLAWLYQYGYLPENCIDHINRNRQDNRMCNLREVSQTCNRINAGKRKDNTSKVKGVYWYGRVNMWIAAIRVNKKAKHLGYYKDFSNAVCARLAGEQCLDWDSCDSSTPAYKYVKKYIQKGETT